MSAASRRDFLKASAIAAGATGLAHILPASIDKAFAIDPAPGSTFWDAEHVVILMQENRSFDHAFGTLQGVRGYDDPRAMTLPSGDPVWVQTNAEGQSYAPFRLDIKHTKSTWMGCLPHGWTDQVDARNEGRFDRWLDVKGSGDKAYAGMPLTMGYYNREDLPFYYALADAFTICDQNFCSTLTGTTPNRLHLWTGKIRHDQNEHSHAKVLNENADHQSEVEWRTFPELLEAEGVSWKIYQNEIYLDVGLGEEGAAWLGNFGDNPLKYFKQFRVRFSEAYRRNLDKLAQTLSAAIDTLKSQLAEENLSPRRRDRLAAQLGELTAQLPRVEQQRKEYSADNFAKLTDREKSIHAKAFCTNSGDPSYHELETLSYRDGDAERTLRIPKGDVFHQFRSDVDAGKLPTVSWIVAPEKFSDHPCSPWYGAWYLAECFNILTRNPEVWKKTIFILTYDENDGYFDHVPPFVAPHPRRPETGRVSADIDASVEFVTRENYISLFDDDVFWLSVFNTLVYTVVATIAKFGLGLWLALLLNNAMPFKAIIRAVVLLPYIVPTVLSAIVFWWIYDPQFSIISWSLQKLGLIDHFIDFLGVPWNARASVIIANVWRGIPFVAICLLAGLQTISPSLYEAAALDGASAWQRFWHVTLPMLMPILGVVLTFSVLFTFTDFQLIYAITRGGPLNATHLMATLAFQRAIPGGDLGQGAAIATAMIPFLIAATVFSYYGLQRRKWQQGSSDD